MSETTNYKLLALNGEATKRVLRVTPIGIRGADGQLGPTGPRGNTGNTGNTGISISGSSLINYNLILTFSDGTTFNVGYIRGETGATGPTGQGNCGGSLETLIPSPGGYYPYASIFVDQYGRVTGASGTTDVASQSNIIDIFDDLTNTEINIAEFQTTISQGIMGGTW